jgi:hypothetical protein
MAITAYCIICDTTRDVGPYELIGDTCSDECAEEFEHLVQQLLGGGNCVALGIDPESRLGRKLIAAAKLLRFRTQRESYENKAAERHWEVNQEAERSRARQLMHRRYFGW